jgi:hypothetical protein
MVFCVQKRWLNLPAGTAKGFWAFSRVFGSKKKQTAESIKGLNRSAHVPFIDSDVCFFCLPKTREKAQNRFAVPDGCFLQRFGTQLTMAA